MPLDDPVDGFGRVLKRQNYNWCPPPIQFVISTGKFGYSVADVGK